MTTSSDTFTQGARVRLKARPEVTGTMTNLGGSGRIRVALDHPLDPDTGLLWRYPEELELVPEPLPEPVLTRLSFDRAGAGHASYRLDVGDRMLPGTLVIGRDGYVRFNGHDLSVSFTEQRDSNS